MIAIKNYESHKDNMKNISIRFAYLFIMSAAMNLVFFGAGFIYSENYGVLDKISYVITTALACIVFSWVFSKNLKIDNGRLIQLRSYLIASAFFGPFLHIMFLILVTPPIFMDGNIETLRAEFREAHKVQSYLFMPSTTISTIIASLFVTIGYKRKLSGLIVLLSTVPGFLSGFRGAAIFPLFILLLIYTSVYISNKGFFGILREWLLSPARIISLILIIACVITILVFTTGIRAGVDLENVASIMQILFNRIVVENSEVNFSRYYEFSEVNGHQYGLTYIKDFLSVLKLRENSFQQELSGGGVLTMTSPLYAELYLNWGFVSFFIIVLFIPIAIISRALLSAARINPCVNILMTYFMAFCWLPFVGHEGFSKFTFVILPKYLVVLIFLTATILIMTSLANSFSQNRRRYAAWH